MSEDFYLPRRVAQWNQTRGAWETGQLDLFSTHSELYLETWSASGMTRDGVAYELPTPELPMADSDYSLLPTALASDGEKGGPNQRGAKGDLRLSSAVLFPTPTTQDAANTGGPSQFDRNSLPLNTLVMTLLPTPAAHDSGNTPENHLRKKPGREVVTSLQVLVNHGLIPTGGRIAKRSNAGNS